MTSVPAVSSAPAPPRESTRSDALYFPLPSLQPGQVLFRTTGAAEIHVGPSVVLTPSSERLFTIMVLCAMSPDHMMARSQLLQYAWPDMEVKSARHTLRQQLYRLRQLGVPLTSNRTAVVLDAACLVPSFSLGRTADLFDRDVLRGQEPFGQLFAGWRPENDVLQRWVEQQRDRYHMDVRRVLLPELHRLRDRAEWLECERWARTVLEFDPLNEDATLILAEAIAMQGSRVDARYMLDGYVRETGVSGTELARHVDEARRRIGRATRVRFEHSATPTLIGRDAELQQLDALTLSAMQGETRVVHILGPTGIGKTELAYEATRRAVILGFTRCIVRVTRPMADVPYGTLSRLVRDLLKLPGALGCRPESISALKLVGGSDSELGDTAIFELSAVKASLAEALSDVVSAISFERPLLIFVDDIQNADTSSRELLGRSIAFVRGQRTVVVLTERTQNETVRADSNDRDAPFVIRLAPLSVADSARLAENVSSASGRILGRDTAALVAAASDRTPLEIITLAREHLVTGITSPTRVSIVEILKRQVLRLPVPARVILQTLAIMGGRCRANELATHLGTPLAVCMEGIAVLLDSGLLQQSDENTFAVHDEVLQSALSTLREVEAHVLRRGLAVSFASRATHSGTPELVTNALTLALDSADPDLFVELCLRLVNVLTEHGMVHAAVRFLETCYTLSQTELQRRTSLQLLVRSAQRAAQWQRVLSASAELAALSPLGKGEHDVEASLTVLEGSIQSQIHLTGQRSVQTAVQIALDVRNQSSTRIRAARLAITAASELFDANQGITAFQVLHSLTPDGERASHEYLETAMQYHTIFGDLQEALRIARSHFDSRSVIAAHANGIRTLTNASLVFRVCGETALALSCLDYCEKQPLVQNSGAMSADLAWRRCVTAIDANDRQETIARGRLFADVTKSSGEDAQLWVKLFMLRLEAVRTGDIEDVSVARSIALSVDSHPNRLMLYCAALCLKSSTFRRDHAAFPTLLQRATRWLNEHGRYTGFDFLCASILEGLELLGCHNQALEIANRYFESSRREKFEPGFVFSGVSESMRMRINGLAGKRFEMQQRTSAGR